MYDYRALDTVTTMLIGNSSRKKHVAEATGRVLQARERDPIEKSNTNVNLRNNRQHIRS